MSEESKRIQKLILQKLAEPFPVAQISWRLGSTNKRKMQNTTNNQNAKPTKGIPLAYIDARDVMGRLDQLFGTDWQCRYPFEGYCEIGLKIDGEWTWRGNGAGVSQVEAVKGQYSDAFKRAGVVWGIGRYLYDMPNTWVDLDEWGKFAPPKLPIHFFPTAPENKK